MRGERSVSCRGKGCCEIVRCILNCRSIEREGRGSAFARVTRTSREGNNFKQNSAKGRGFYATLRPFQSTKIPGTDIAFSSTIYKVPQTTGRPALPILRHKPMPMSMGGPHPQRPIDQCLVQKRHPSSQLQNNTSPMKRPKMDRVEQEQFSHMVSGEVISL